MKKNPIEKVIVHLDEGGSLLAVADQIDACYMGVIERMLKQSKLSPEAKIEAIDQIIVRMKSGDER